MLDGIYLGKHLVVIAVGIDEEGERVELPDSTVGRDVLPSDKRGTRS